MSSGPYTRCSRSPPSAFIAHTSGWPSGTVIEALRTASRSSGSSSQTMTVCVAATQM